MIKLNINIGSCSTKVVVDLMREQQLNVISFLKRVVQICGLDDLHPQQMQLFDGQFLLPHLLPSRCILQDRVYTVVADRKSKKDAMLLKKKEKDRKAKHKKVVESNSQSPQSSQKPQSSQSPVDIRKKIKRGKYQKRQTSPKDNVRIKQSIKDQKNSKAGCSNSIVVRHQKNKQQKNDGNKISKNKRSETKQKLSSQGQDQDILQSDESSSPLIAPNKSKNIGKSQQKLQSQQSQQSSSPLPQLPKKATVIKKQVNTTHNIAKINQPNTISSANIKKGPILGRNKKQSSEQASSSQSAQIPKNQSSQQDAQPSFYDSKFQQVLSNINAVSRAYGNNKDSLDKIQFPSTKRTDKPKNIPISVRNKISKPSSPPPVDKLPTKKPTTQITKSNASFKEHQQQKWVPITKQILKQWQIKNSGIFVQQKNQIRFKIVQLDEQKFVPVSSGWIVGYFTKKQSGDTKDSVIYLDNVTKNSREDNGSPQFIKNYEIPIHNLQQLQINKNTLNDKQKEILKFDTKEVQNVISNKPVSIEKPKIAVKSVQKPIQQKKQQSLQQFICGQIHYYFTDKNYNTDLFMQMHANKDAQKYIPIKLMLNFPKIKKVLNNENKLWDYLTTDILYAIRSYELDYVRKMIRKKDEISNIVK